VQTQPQPQPQTTPRAIPPLIQIRDFAFALTDERYAGLGPDAPKANQPRRVNRYHYQLQRSSTSSLASSSSSSEDGNDDEEEEDGEGEGGKGWSGFRWGFGRFGWGIGVGRGDANVQKTDETDGGPHGLPTPDPDSSEVYPNDDAEEDGTDEIDLPLRPGLYRALYAFEPEGTAEMRMEEDQVVRVLGSGGGVGWAVVLRDVGVHALVPESYLEIVSLDEEEECASASGE
jgi:hypothetical protein